MKIKCFSKRKLNVRISKTRIKCAILGFSQNCCILGKSRKKLVKFSKNSAKIQQILANFATFCKNQEKNSAIFNEKIEIRERCKGATEYHGVAIRRHPSESARGLKRSQEKGSPTNGAQISSAYSFVIVEMFLCSPLSLKF